MTIAFMKSIQGVLDGYFKTPAWLLVGNYVWGRMEAVTAVAIFDTKEMADAYELAARRPDPGQENGRWRGYRLGSALYDFNLGEVDDGGPRVRPAPPWVDWSELPQNPSIDVPCPAAPVAAGQDREAAGG